MKNFTPSHCAPICNLYGDVLSNRFAGKFDNSSAIVYSAPFSAATPSNGRGVLFSSKSDSLKDEFSRLSGIIFTEETNS